jgi:hypothetical protein
MAAGAKPALESTTNNQTEAPQSPNPKPLTFMDRIARKLTEIFEYNERLGSTRQ